MHPATELAIAHLQHAEDERRAVLARMRRDRGAVRRAARMSTISAALRGRLALGNGRVTPACCPA